MASHTELGRYKQVTSQLLVPKPDSDAVAWVMSLLDRAVALGPCVRRGPVHFPKTLPRYSEGG